MKKIETIEWGEFRVGDLFDVKYGKFTPKTELGTGNANYITTSGLNNGITDKIEVAEYQGNCITVASDGAMGSSFYQKEPFSTSNIVSTLKPKDGVPLNQYNAQFICTIIRAKSVNYSWAEQKMSVDRVRNLLIKLPTTSDGTPDYKYMEQYMREIEEKAKEAIDTILLCKNESKVIDISKWKEFRVGDLFEMLHQKEISPKMSYTENIESDTKYPYYGQSSENNGIIDYIYLADDSLLNNSEGNIIIMIHSNTHLAYLVDTPFYLKDGHGATSLFYNKNLNKHNVKYIISVLNKTMTELFTYDKKATKEKLRELIIRLPVTASDEPDYQYMENYIKDMEVVANNYIDIMR